MVQKSPRYYRAVVIGLLLVLCGAALDLAVTLHRGGGNAGTGRLDAKMIASRPGSPAARQMPQFIPQVAPDPGYPANHPGWQRYRSDALEYLVYREKGDVKAVQVLSEQPGAISPPFLKTCIRLSTGNERFVTKKTEAKSGLQITTGALQNGGEIVIYRVAANQEIRGFVLTFPAPTQTAAATR